MVLVLYQGALPEMREGEETGGGGGREGERSQRNRSSILQNGRGRGQGRGGERRGKEGREGM